MASLKEVIQHEFNPFDLTTSVSGNFWNETQDLNLTVDSIHQEELNQIIAMIDRVARDRRTRTLLLKGDQACGKSYLLGRLKKKLNHKAFFAYIGSWADHDYIWRHILRCTVDSLMYKPEGQNESQLLLWLKSLSAFEIQGIKKKILGERTLFIRNFQGTYPVGIYRSKEFFGVLYDLTNPELYPLACDWLRGEDLDDSDLKALGVRESLKIEDDAKNILANFGKISSKTQYPIVLCFDQIDQKLLPPDGYLGLQILFGANTTIHNENLQNFAIIISLIESTWNHNKNHIIGADKDRFYLQLHLTNINLEQAEKILAKRLYPLHQKAQPKPKSLIEPLTRQDLQDNLLDRTTPRYVIQLGHQKIQEYKTGEVSSPPDSIAAFKQVWDKEFSKTKKKIDRIRKLASPDLAKNLQQSLMALQIQDINSKSLKHKKYGSYSFSYKSLQERKTVGIFWNEDPNMRSLNAAMQTCEKEIKDANFDSLILIRAETLGDSKNKGYKLFQKIFTGSPHRHVTPHIDSVHYLATYSSLVNAACAGELVVGYETPNLSELEFLVRESQVLHKCTLLKELGLVTVDESEETEQEDDIQIQMKKLLQDATESILTLVQLQGMLGLTNAIEHTRERFDLLTEAQILDLIYKLEHEEKIQVWGNEKNTSDRFVSWQTKN